MSTVLARRIIAVSPDPGFADAVVAALSAVADAVDVRIADDVLGAIAALEATAPGQAALYVVRLDAAARGSGLAAPCPVLVVAPGASLAEVVALMQASDRVAGAMIAPELDPRRLAALAARILAGDAPVGLAQVMAPDTPIHTRAVGDDPDRSRCLRDVAQLVEQARVPGPLRAPIEQCLDELVMNALYDAPIDARGARLFAGLSVRARLALRTEHAVRVQYACDGKQLALCVRDGFGSLARETVLGHLHDGLHAAQRLEERGRSDQVAGAGLGLYLIANAATVVHFEVVPGVATEVLCVFDLDAPAPALAQLGFVQRDATGRPATTARRFPAGSRLRRYAPRVAIVAAVAVLAVVARCATLTPPAPPIVEIDSQPTGAQVAIDGASVGSTPVTLTSLVPGQQAQVVLQLRGYRAARAQLEVPSAGGRTRLVQPLERSDAFVRVHFVSSPPGAEIVNIDRPSAIDRTYAPADVFVEVDQVQRFTLTMPGHAPLVIAPFVPTQRDGARGLEKGGTLAIDGR